MRKALISLKEKSKSATSRESVDSFADFVIDPNYLYVEIAPISAAQEAEIKQDSSLIVFDYPLDYEFTDQVLDSRPQLAPNEFPVYYSAIKIDSDLASESYYQTLEQLYIPEEDPYFDDGLTIQNKVDKKIIQKRQVFFDELLEEAYRLTGNEYQGKSDKTPANRLIFGTRWWPSGTISIFDEVAGRNVPVVGVKVLIRQGFTVRHAITDENGYFKTSSVRGSARYIIQWERYDYSIRNGALFQAELRGPMKKDEAWNYTINNGSGDSDDKYHALIHQAAHDYYYGHRFGLISPPRNGFANNQMKIAAREVAGASYHIHTPSELTIGLYPRVVVKEWGSAADKIYGTTIHELTHAAHSVLDRINYDLLVKDAFFGDFSAAIRNRNRRLLETWPTTVEVVMTLERYRTKFGDSSYEYGNTNGFFYRNMQRKTILEDNLYTSCGFDMIDNMNQRDFFGNTYPIDNVSGYTISQLQVALVGASSWNEWRDNIKNRYNNPTEIYLDELFNNWQD
ncbi:hypothetical protein ACNQGB_08370 [Flavobacterium sp. XS1P32]|uniref:hypothetical protein n=1 Tax=Flavobacterium sp. XS1P32 TaxID=3401726 RepID=UPI003AAEE23C